CWQRLLSYGRPSTDAYSLSLHDALPISRVPLQAAIGSYACVAVNRLITSGTKVLGVFGEPFWARVDFDRGRLAWCKINPRPGEGDRKSTRLNSSHLVISYAVFCLKKHMP